jgi:hypothetical protein
MPPFPHPKTRVRGTASAAGLVCALGLLGALPCMAAVAPSADTPLASFTRDIQPILDQYCYDCHGGGFKKGGVQLDEFKTDADIQNHALWLRVVKNVRADIMPPATEERLPSEDERKLMTWIKLEAFSLDPEHPDPGRVTVRRLNRVEYRNTIKDLVGVKFDTLSEFPADDTGQGFDNLGDVLTISPMLLERYLDAAQTIVSEAVPTQPRVEATAVIRGRDFAAKVPALAVADIPAAPAATLAVADKPASATSTGGNSTGGGDKLAAPPPPPFRRPQPKALAEALDLSYYTPTTVTASYHATHPGKYRVAVNLTAVEAYVDDQFDLNRCRLVFKVDGETLISQEFVRESDKEFDFSFDRTWQPGDHPMSFEVQPIGPDKVQNRQLRIRLSSVTVHGPAAPEFWVQPDTYARYFPQPVPWWPASRRKYAAQILGDFATRAFRRPVDAETVDRMVKLSESVSHQPGNTFEAGIAQAMVAVLASPRFIFRAEEVEPLQKGQVNPYIDEYSLASRLSYFLWSSMPDQELFTLAAKGQLRAQLPDQLKRMLASPKASEFVSNFTGQWLEARDIGDVQINPLSIYLREHPDAKIEAAMDRFRALIKIPDDKRTDKEKEDFKVSRATFFTLFRAPKAQLTGPLREAMRRETEMDFAYVIKEDRSLVELIDCNYTFLNEDLAKHYGIPGVTGHEMRKVMLPPDSPRGGILTQGTTLTVTSNPTRTSPVKRGVFILDAILGTRPPPPPPNIPALEDAASPEKLRTMTLRENLALHASNKSCAACHSRMDPLGLALENFNAMGAWRDGELGRQIDTAGHLITGEKFANIRELKHVLATSRRRDFYYCITQKLMTYALGRTLDYYDVDTVDRIVEQLEASGGKPSVLLQGIINSAAFEQSRQPAHEEMASNAVAPSPDTAIQ